MTDRDQPGSGQPQTVVRAGGPWAGPAAGSDSGASGAAAAGAGPWQQNPAPAKTAPGSPWTEEPRAASGAGGPAAAEPPQPVYPPPIRPIYDGRLSELYAIHLKNLVLSVLTFGLYRFWGRTRMRRYLWSHTAMFGDRFEYLGRGLELFFGFLVGLGGLLILIGATFGVYRLVVGARDGAPVGIEDVVTWGLLLLGYPLLFVGQYGGLRYKLTRTSWRGIRGALDGSAWAYGGLATGLSLANMMCASLLLPLVQTRTTGFQLRNARLGLARIEFAGQSGDIYGRFIAFYFLNILAWAAALAAAGFAAWGLLSETFGSDIGEVLEGLGQLNPRSILIVVLIALVGYTVFGVLILPLRCWYMAYFLRYVVSRTRLAGMLFVTGVRTRQMWGYLVLNYLIVILTLGLGLPWVLHRTMRLVSEQLWIYGQPDQQQIRRDAAAGPDTGEGLLDLFAPGAV